MPLELVVDLNAKGQPEPRQGQRTVEAPISVNMEDVIAALEALAPTFERMGELGLEAARTMDRAFAEINAILKSEPPEAARAFNLHRPTRNPGWWHRFSGSEPDRAPLPGRPPGGADWRHRWLAFIRR